MKKEEIWKVNTKELFDNDLIESGDIVAFRGKTWKEYLENADSDLFYNIGIVYYPEKDTKTFFHLTNKRIEFQYLENYAPFILIKSGIKWSKMCEELVKSFILYPKLLKTSKLNDFLTIFGKNKTNSSKFTSSTFVTNFLNMNGYKINPVGMTPTRLVEKLINIIGRKVIEIDND